MASSNKKGPAQAVTASAMVRGGAAPSVDAGAAGESHADLPTGLDFRLGIERICAWCWEGGKQVMMACSGI